MANNPRVRHKFRTTATIGYAHSSTYFRVPLHVFPRDYYSNCVKYSETSSTSRTFTHMTP